MLESKRRAPKSGKARSMVIFVHGYGADGADLLGLADPLAPHLPDTVFYSPNAPETCVNNPFGYQWFPIPWLDGSTEAAAKASMAVSLEKLNAFIDAKLEEENVAPQALALVGFSQGTMMSLHIAPRRDVAVAGVVGFSGRLLTPESLEAEAKVKPPIMLIHGDADEIVPYADMARAGDALVSAGFEVYGHTMKGTGHGIAPDGLQVALTFLHDVLPK